MSSRILSQLKVFQNVLTFPQVSLRQSQWPDVGFYPMYFYSDIINLTLSKTRVNFLFNITTSFVNEMKF